MKSIHSAIIFGVIIAAGTVVWLTHRPSEPGSHATSGGSEGRFQQLPLAPPSKASTSKPRSLGTSRPSQLSRQQAVANYEHAEKCYAALNRTVSANNIAAICRQLGKGGTTQQASQCERIENNLDTAVKELNSCSDLDSTPRAFFEATREAALAGDRSARACYVQGTFAAGDGQMGYRPEEIEEYRHVAPTYISEGLANGDWNIVLLLSRHGNVGDAYNPLKLVTHDDPYQAYVMNRLLQLGATPQYAIDIEAKIQASFLAPRMNAGPFITPDAAAKGNAEAQTIFRRAFASQPPLNGDPAICATN